MKLEQQTVRLSDQLERFLIFVAQMQQQDGLTDLNKQESNVIFKLGEVGAMIMRELAETLRLHVSTMPGIVDKLTEKGFVERERPEDDRRIVRVDLTEKGANAYRIEAEKRRKLVWRCPMPLIPSKNAKHCSNFSAKLFLNSKAQFSKTESKLLLLSDSLTIKVFSCKKFYVRQQISSFRKFR